MKSRKKNFLGVYNYIGNFETYTRHSEVADKTKDLGGDCLFKLSKGGGSKKKFKKPWSIQRNFINTEIPIIHTEGATSLS